MESTLLLNMTYEPLCIVNWQRAITLWYQGKVEIVASHDREIRAVTFSMKLPSVVRFLRLIRVRHREGHVPFTRANIYARDGYRCQYCGERFAVSDLTFDHVVPVAQGGRRTWENIVTACYDCNMRKDNRTPEQARMVPLRTPRKPKSTPTLRLGVGLRRMPDSWRDWLYWHIELED